MASTDRLIDTDCKLLLHCDGSDTSTTFTDSELNTPKTVTANGSAQVDTGQSKFGGASLMLNGTTDYLSLASSTDWAFGTGDFTIDFWARFTGINNKGIFDGGYGSSKGVAMFYNGGTALGVYILGVERAEAAVVLSLNTWHHIAIVRSGTSLKIYINGTNATTSLGTDSSDINDGSFGFLIGKGSVIFFDGWIDEFRITKGTAIYTTNFTPNIAPYPILSTPSVGANVGNSSFFQMF